MLIIYDKCVEEIMVPLEWNRKLINLADFIGQYCTVNIL